MVRVCIISMHSFHQTALLLLLGVPLCSHLPKCLPSYVPLHLTQISLHHTQLCSVLCNHMQKYPFVLVWFVFLSRKSQCLSCPMVTFILQPSEPGLLARAARAAGESMRCWEPSANPGGRCYERKKRKGKPLSSRQTWELLHISPPQGRQAAPMRWELLRD